MEGEGNVEERCRNSACHAFLKVKLILDFEREADVNFKTMVG